MSEVLLSKKFRDFLRYSAPVEFLEGTTYAGKTTVGIMKFMFRVAASPKRFTSSAAWTPEQSRKTSSTRSSAL